MFEFKYPDFSSRMKSAAEHAGGAFVSRSQNVTLAEAVTAIGGKKVNPDTARRWFEGFAMPRAKMVPHIAAALKVSSEWLETGRGDMCACTPINDMDSTAAIYVASLLSCGGIPAIAEKGNVSFIVMGEHVIISCFGLHEMKPGLHKKTNKASVYVFFNDRLDIPRLIGIPPEEDNTKIVFQNDMVMTSSGMKISSMDMRSIIRMAVAAA